jgi:hypothetical protein
MQAEFVKICSKIFKIAAGSLQTRLAAKARLDFGKKVE